MLVNGTLSESFTWVNIGFSSFLLVNHRSTWFDCLSKICVNWHFTKVLWLFPSWYKWVCVSISFSSSGLVVDLYRLETVQECSIRESIHVFVDWLGNLDPRSSFSQWTYTFFFSCNFEQHLWSSNDDIIILLDPDVLQQILVWRRIEDLQGCQCQFHFWFFLCVLTRKSNTYHIRSRLSLLY